MRLLNPYTYINPTFDMSDIKIIYTPGVPVMPKASIFMGSTQKRLPPEETAAVEAEWAKALAKEPLVNEDTVSVRFIDLETGDLKVAPSDYKSWKTMAKKGFYKRFGDLYIPNALNVQMLAETADGKLVLGTRPPKEDGKQPAFQVPGGMLTMADAKDGHIAPEVAATREFSEEVGRISMQDVAYLGASFYAGRVITTLYYTAKLGMTAGELTAWRQENQADIKDFKAFPQEHYVPMTDQGIQAARESGRLRETAEVGLLLKGRQKLGPEWFRRMCPKRMR